MATHLRYSDELARAIARLGDANGVDRGAAGPAAPPARLSNTPLYAEVVERVVRHVHAPETQGEASDRDNQHP